MTRQLEIALDRSRVTITLTEADSQTARTLYGALCRNAPGWVQQIMPFGPDETWSVEAREGCVTLSVGPRP